VLDNIRFYEIINQQKHHRYICIDGVSLLDHFQKMI